MFAGKKTYITAALASLTAIAAYLVGEAPLADTAQLVFTALLAAFVRSGLHDEIGSAR
jgi:VIT1/CCC1 family predicted Fe2+/Mn2+ transporter